MKKFKISIPKPCHEDWSKMTPKEKGRFCASCSKTVVDFTKKSTEEIQEYLLENRGKRVCGHFYREQLDSIVLQIPESTFQQQLSFQKLFIITLLFVMGTTLFSCKTDNGKVQKIEKVELIYTIVKTKQIINTLSTKKVECKKDTLKEKIKVPPPPSIAKIIEITGDLPIPPSIEKEKMLGEIVEIDTIFQEYEDTFCPLISLDSYPKFEKHKEVSNKESKELFKKEINEFISKNFEKESTINLSLKPKKYKILSKIEIDGRGNVIDINVNAPHPQLKKDVEMILKNLPKFIPATKDGKNVSTSYTIPIHFVIE